MSSLPSSTPAASIPLLLGLLAVACSPGTPRGSDVVGTYTVVSESEWALDLNPREDGRAVVVATSWAPGEFEDREIIETPATWALEGSSITVRYHGRSDTFQYRPSVSTTEFGRPGSLPGLVIVGPVADESVFVDGFVLWRADSLRNATVP